MRILKKKHVVNRSMSHHTAFSLQARRVAAQDWTVRFAEMFRGQIDQGLQGLLGAFYR